MLSTGIAGLAAAYVLIVLLALAVVLYTRWRWPVKAAAAAATVAFCILSWLAVPDLVGWPVEAVPPRTFRLHAAHVQQPDKLTKSKGAIHLWVSDSADLGHPAVPRAYRFPYTTATHETVINAVARMNKGQAQMGEILDPEATRGTRLHDPAAAGEPSLQITFYDIPDPLFPDK